MFVLSFVEEDGGLKLSRCEEFIDSHAFVPLMAKVKAAAAGSLGL